MGKRYYVEVTGLGEDGAEELAQAGVSKESILVMEDKDLPPVEQAILEAMGVTMASMRTDSRMIDIVAARIIYVHYRLMEGQTIASISKEIKKGERYTRFYRQQFDDKLFGDKTFVSANSRVAALLEANPMWSAIEMPKPATVAENKPKRKQRRRKKRRQRKKRPPQAIIEQIIEKRQYKIDFENRP